MWNTTSFKRSFRFLCKRSFCIPKRGMPSPCCTNCRTKYSILNPEEGCSNCALSFCRKCLPHRAILPQLADKPVTVCSQCFEKLNAKTLENQKRNGTQITHIRIDDLPQQPSSSANNVRPNNWWGDGLPPPSMRQSIGQPSTHLLRGNVRTHTNKVEHPNKNVGDLEERWKKSRQDDSAGQPLTLSQIEERLAALRGCDVELIRRPRCIFESASKPIPTGNSVHSLMEMAKERAEIEERHDPAKELERRHRALREDEERHPSSSFQPDQVADSNANVSSEQQSDPRLSTVSSATAFSEATTKELADINSLLADAQRRVNASQAEEKDLDREMKSVMAATRQKSLDIEKVTNEIGHFWDKRLDKVELSDSDEESIDDETMKKIILEAEQAVEDGASDGPTPSSESGAPKNVAVASAAESTSPRKPGLFSRIFKR
ncbi:hypothetical protein Y032_0969g3245 [Ancylostoma ceylanicum]|nr:hypothetical protein Y032_0969g3245 [Ancylostoma ceylanicum]